MELALVKLSYVNPSTKESKAAETYVAVYPWWGEHIVESAARTAMLGVISKNPADWEEWQVTVDYVERFGVVHVAQSEEPAADGSP